MHALKRMVLRFFLAFSSVFYSFSFGLAPPAATAAAVLSAFCPPRLSFHFEVFNYIAFSGKSSWLICSWFLEKRNRARKTPICLAAPSTKCDTTKSKYKLNLQLKGRKRLPWHCVHFVWHSALANKQLNAKCDTQRGPTSGRDRNWGRACAKISINQRQSYASATYRWQDAKKNTAGLSIQSQKTIKITEGFFYFWTPVGEICCKLNES